MGKAQPCSFARATSAFASGADTPRDFLERCIAEIEAREKDVKAFTALRDNPIRAESLGIDTSHYTLLAFAIGTVGGLAVGLWLALSPTAAARGGGPLGRGCRARGLLELGR